MECDCMITQPLLLLVNAGNSDRSFSLFVAASPFLFSVFRSDPRIPGCVRSWSADLVQQLIWIRGLTTSASARRRNPYS